MTIVTATICRRRFSATSRTGNFMRSRTSESAMIMSEGPPTKAETMKRGARMAEFQYGRPARPA